MARKMYLDVLKRFKLNFSSDGTCKIHWSDKSAVFHVTRSFDQIHFDKIDAIISITSYSPLFSYLVLVYYRFHQILTLKYDFISETCTPPPLFFFFYSIGMRLWLTTYSSDKFEYMMWLNEYWVCLTFLWAAT